MGKLKTYSLLHFILILYSLSTICSKMASRQGFLTKQFILFYILVVIILGIYAIGWQQIIKRLSLTEAFANKSVTVVWGIVWGRLFFSEAVTLGKILGALLVIIGIILYSGAEERPNE